MVEKTVGKIKENEGKKVKKKRMSVREEECMREREGGRK